MKQKALPERRTSDRSLCVAGVVAVTLLFSPVEAAWVQKAAYLAYHGFASEMDQRLVYQQRFSRDYSEMRADVAFLTDPRSRPGDEWFEPRSAGLIAVTSAAKGEVRLVDRDGLSLVRTVAPAKGPPPAAPMLIVEDVARACFYVGNFSGGLGRIPNDGGEPRTLNLGGDLIGLAISPDGRLLAVNGAHDLTLRLVDLDSWKEAGRVRLGIPADAPRHSHMTHGLASTHPIWLADGSGILTEDNIHEDVVLVGHDAKERARAHLRSGVHTFLAVSKTEALALAEGTVDGAEPPRVIVLAIPSLRVVREIRVPLEPGEPAKLHHGTLSHDGEVVIVANMGPMHGEQFGSTVAAIRWRTGDVLWHKATVRNAGHVRFLDSRRVAVLGHRDAQLAVLDVATGERLETWRVPGATAMGHALATEPAGTVLIIDAGAGKLVRVGPDGVRALSPALGEDVSEASLPE